MSFSFILLGHALWPNLLLNFLYTHILWVLSTRRIAYKLYYVKFILFYKKLYTAVERLTLPINSGLTDSVRYSISSYKDYYNLQNEDLQGLHLCPLYIFIIFIGILWSKYFKSTSHWLSMLISFCNLSAFAKYLLKFYCWSWRNLL